jgi:hypothetical protein
MRRVEVREMRIVEQARSPAAALVMLEAALDASQSEAAWLRARSPSQGGWPMMTQPVPRVTPRSSLVITGQVDSAALDRMVKVFLARCGLAAHAWPRDGGLTH